MEVEYNKVDKDNKEDYKEKAKENTSTSPSISVFEQRPNCVISRKN